MATPPLCVPLFQQKPEKSFFEGVGKIFIWGVSFGDRDQDAA
jgi:hypothetical protein